MTLDPSSTLGRSLPCLVGAGGGEVAFAATRSLSVTLALHAAMLSAIDGGGDKVIESLLHPVEPQVDAALGALADKTTIIVSGRGVFRGVAEAASLMLMELARMPALGFEIGQFRHGPMELLSPDRRRRPAVRRATPTGPLLAAWPGRRTAPDASAGRFSTAAAERRSRTRGPSPSRRAAISPRCSPCFRRCSA